MNVYENVVIRFSASNKNTTFHVFLRTPRYRQPSATSPATTRRHVFIVDVDEDMMQHKNPLINVQNNVPSLADPWYHYLADNDLMSGDEVVFYYTFKKHGWDVLFRKQLIWDDEQSE
ncbi:hypothetical protein JHK82_044608 [Glycine max]|nr:hypothetical protein JHK86_045011 [Glycine max]KAG4951712.1 hypothetical protein JHK85_045579 [Glycine max]KAG5099556.1 hypothetical protein JHK82_044608 [Glycine max]KAG5108158.1 hypothetical protein JHK84_045065 [Glycine max]